MKRNREAVQIVARALRSTPWPDPGALATLAVEALTAAGWKLTPPDGAETETVARTVPANALIPDPETTPLLRPSEVAPLLKWSKNTVYSLIESGELESLKVKGRYWIPTTALRAFLHLDNGANGD